jgi:hypothetical protein
MTFWVDDWQHDALKDINDRDGIRQAEQIRRALTNWIKSRGIEVPKTERRLAPTSRRS